MKKYLAIVMLLVFFSCQKDGDDVKPDINPEDLPEKVFVGDLIQPTLSDLQDFHNRNYIEHKPKKIDGLSIDAIFGEEGVFSKHFDKYELREGQVNMAQAVLDNFEKMEFLLVEAGTGVGKSLAYLIPSINIRSVKTRK